MGERRKRKSLWDTEEETRHFSGTGENNSWTGKEHYSSNDAEHYHEFSTSGSYRAQKFRDHSGKPYLKLIEENPVAPVNGSFIKRRENTPDGSFIKHREDTPERKEIGGGNRYYENMSPGFKYSHSLGNDRSHSHRYPGRGRSRSRTRGRSHSRSLSRGREREKVRGRSRSRSRSRSDGSARGQTRSRSPIRDYRQSYRWSDRRSLPEKATEICSDFAAGRCRRGSQCKYFHPKDIIHRDADLVGADTSESWRSRADHGRISRHSYSSRGPRSELRDDVSDPYHGEDEQFQNKSRSAVPCKDFMKGKCRWGDTCRFSHHFASDETFGKGTRYTSSDKDIEHQPYKNGKPLCKYFAAGKCDRDNCRFSHEDSRFNSREGRQGKLTDDHSLHDKGNKRNGPTWNDATSFTGNVKPSGWNEFTVTNNHGDNTNGKNDNRWSHSWGNENINWGIPDQTDNLIDRDKRTSPPAGNGSYSGDLGTAESISKGNMANKQELLMLPHSQSQNQDGNLNVKVQNKLPEDERFSMRTWQQTVSPVSRIQQQDHGVVENNVESSFQSDVLDVMKDSRNAINPIPLSGQDKSQNGEHAFTGHSSIPSETDSGLNMHGPNPSDVFSGDFRGPGIHLLANLNLQSQMQNHQKAIQMTGMLETKVPQFFPNLINSERSASLVSGTDQQVAPVTIPIMFPTQGTENEHSQKNTDTQVCGSMGMELSSSDASGHVPLVGNTNLQSNPLRVSHDPINPMENGRGINEQEKHTEQGNEMQGGRSSPVSIVGMEPGSSEVCHSGQSVVKLETVLANSEVDEAKRAIGEESKGVKNNKDSETLDGYGKAEENNANKDDKAMRLFKNSLIEFVKDILKPTWKEGRMSREVHKTIVKKVVDKVTSTIQVDHIPKTQDKVEQYLSYSKPKIAKLIQAYIDRSLKTDS